MIPHFGPVELILILVIVIMLFGVGKLPEVFGAVGRGIREFRRNSGEGMAETPVARVDQDTTVQTGSASEPTHTH